MKNKVILISSDKLGKGDDKLGEKLLASFCSLLPQGGELPVAIFCMNSGVYAMTGKSPSSEHLKVLSDGGVPIIGCKTCLDSYDVTDKIVVGKVGTMLKFIELANEYEIITIN